MLLSFTNLALLAVASGSAVVTGFRVPEGHGPKIIPGRFIVSVSTSGPHNLNKRAGEIISTVIDSIKDSGIDALTKKTFQAPGLLTGASITVPESTTAADLLAVPGVNRVWPVRSIPHPRTYISKDGAGYSAGHTSAVHDGVLRRGLNEPRNAYAGDTFPPHTMTGVDKMHEKKLLGAGIRVGVIDSGVDYLNPALGGCFGPGCKVAFGAAFVGDEDDTFKGPDPYTNCSEHGTHVTGIIGANRNSYGFTGVAPQATLGHYRVFSCTGDTGDDTILEALLQADKDNCDVINMSIGGSIGWLDGSPVQAVVEKLNNKGIITMTSTGNEQSEGLFFSSFPAATKTGMAIASVDVSALPAYNMQFLTGGYKPVPYLAAAPFLPNKSLELYFTSTDSSKADDGCSQLPSSTPDLKDRLVVIQRGTCNFVVKFACAHEKGARFIMIYNSATGSTMPYLEPGTTEVTDVAGLRREDGLKLLSYYTASLKSKQKVLVSFPSDSQLVPGILDTVSGSQISDFSNFGPTNEMYQQPSFAAPGGNILSTFPLAMGGVGVLSGTSMAAPFAAGAAAIILSARKSEKLNPQQIRQLFSSTAAPVAVSRNTSTPLTTVVLQGGGLIAVDRAYAAKTFISPNVLMLNDTAFFNGTQTITITNKNSKSVTYRYEASGAQVRSVYDDNAQRVVLPSLVPPASAGQASVAFRPGRITVGAGKTASFRVTIEAPKFSSRQLAQYPVYSGFISITADDASKQKFQVPYFGLAGKMSSMPILDTTSTFASDYQDGLKYPFISDGSSAQINANTVKTYDETVGITLYFRLAQATREWTVDLIAANSTFKGTISTSNNANLKRRSDLPAFSNEEFESLDDAETIGGMILPRGERLQTRAAQTYDSVKIIGRIENGVEQARDYAKESGVGQGYSDHPVVFTGQYQTTPTSGVFAKATVNTPYRLLLRARKTTADPTLEASWESWVSPPFKFSN